MNIFINVLIFIFFHFDMALISNNYESFLKILIEQRDKRNCNSNVYQIFPQLPDYKNKFNLFSIYEDSLEKEVRCPICLGRVGLAVRPSKYLLQIMHRKMDEKLG